MRPRVLLTALAAGAALAFPAAAGAAGFQQIFDDYKSDGRINGCYNAYELDEARRQIPPDVEQYAPGFGNQLASAQGRCDRNGTPAAQSDEEAEETSPAPISAGTPGPGAPKGARKKTVREPPAPERAEQAALDLPRPQLGSVATANAGETPGGLLALLVASALALLLAIAWTVAWFMGWNTERMTKPLTAAFGNFWDRLSPSR